jgi:hypothetical protein
LKLAGNEPENAQQVGAAVAIHGCQDSRDDYPELVCGNASSNLVEPGGRLWRIGQKWHKSGSFSWSSRPLAGPSDRRRDTSNIKSKRGQRRGMANFQICFGSELCTIHLCGAENKALTLT